MYPHIAYVFIDGAYLRARAKELNRELFDPLHLGRKLVGNTKVKTWASKTMEPDNALLGRITYYDALADDPSQKDPELEEYWKAVELQDDVHLGFGALRGLTRKPRQKAVDTLIAVDMVVGAFTGLFDIAILVAGDADFVPVVEEVKRRGVMVTVAAFPTSLADELRRAADRVIEIQDNSECLRPMKVNGRVWGPCIQQSD